MYAHEFEKTTGPICKILYGKEATRKILNCFLGLSISSNWIIGQQNKNKLEAPIPIWSLSYNDEKA